MPSFTRDYNLAQIAEAGARFQIFDPFEFNKLDPSDDALKVDAWVDLVGLDGPTGKAAAARMVEAVNKKKKTRKNAKDYTDMELLALLEDDQEVKARFFSELLTGWDGFENESGAAIPFSQSAAEKQFSETPWLMDQIDYFLGQRREFKKQSDARLSTSPIAKDGLRRQSPKK